MKYETKGNNTGWSNKGPWYNTTICSEFHGTVFEDLLRNDRTDRYNSMCSINSQDRQQSTYVDDATSSGSIAIPKSATTEAIKLLVATLNFIDCWLKRFQHKYQETLEIYHNAVIELFKQIPTKKSKPLSQDKKHQFLLTNIGVSWYTKKRVRRNHHLKSEAK